MADLKINSNSSFDYRTLITSEQKDMIKNYIKDYAIGDDCYAGKVLRDMTDVDTILQPWAKAKNEGILPFIFKNKLIISESIEFNTPQDELKHCLSKNLDVQNFMYQVREWIYNKASTAFSSIKANDYTRYHKITTAILELLNEDTLIQNKYLGLNVTIPVLNGHNITVPHGCKPVKMLGKLNKEFNFSDKFEKFRIGVSRCLNTAKIKGNLCLSIHPFDYMTMSDNDCDWESCMNWRNYGSYRQGTVEMMNSSCVIVAYLTAKENMIINRSHGYYWNNKKWRSLYIVHPDYIGNIKGYPYQIPEIDKKVINKIKNLLSENGYDAQYGDIKVRNNLNRTIASEHGQVELTFTTSHMYNDFGTIAHFGCVREDDAKTSSIHIHYSGMSECMWCGQKYDAENEESLACEQCYEEIHCDGCGDHFSRDNLILTVDGDYVCEYCYSEYYAQSFRDGEYHNIDNMSRIYVLPDEYRDAVKQDCINFGAFGRNVPFFWDHETSYLFFDCNKKKLQKFLNDNKSVHCYICDNWFRLEVPYVFLGDLKEEYQKEILEHNGYLSDVMDNDFYDAWQEAAPHIFENSKYAEKYALCSVGVN